MVPRLSMADSSGSGSNVNEDGCSIGMDVQDQNPTLIDDQESFASAKLRRQATADAAFLRNLSTMQEATDKVSVFADDRSRFVGHPQDYARYRQMYLRMYCPFATEERKASVKDKTKKLLMNFKLTKEQQKKSKTARTGDRDSQRKHNKSATGDASTASQLRSLFARVRRFFGCHGGNLDVLDFSFRKNNAVTPLP